MLRRYVIVALAALLLPKAKPQFYSQELIDNLVDFEKNWSIFIKDLFGCSGYGEVNQDNCNFSLGRFNFKKWEDSRKAAKKLFDLRD